ncbi:hypothetical protein [Enterocloster citroniae]|uniref:hypothetical protein n=1 Tax=Enterocloster citroniae TaxID=358743 RepID=UPI0022E143E9|nr:hypothetical protein [Enterocloster citroniae]
MATVDEILTRQAYAAGDETWTKDNNYPSYTMYAEPEYVPVTNKRIADFNDQVSVRGEQNAQFVGFQLPRYDDAMDLTKQNLYIHYQTVYGGSDGVPCNVSWSDNYVRMCWKIPAQATQEPGSIQMMIYATGTDSVGDRTVWKTLPATYTIHDGLEIGGGIPEPDQSWYEQFVAQMEGKVSTAQGYANDAQASKVAAAGSATAAAQSADASAQALAENKDYVESQKETFVGYNKRETDLKYANALIGSASGTGRVSVGDAWEAPIPDLRISGESEQVSTTGAQLFDASKLVRTHNEVKFTVEENGGILVTGNTLQNAANSAVVPVTLSPGTYYMSGSTPIGNSQIFVRIKLWHGDSSTVISDASFSVDGTETKIECFIQLYQGLSDFKAVVYPMLNAGSTPKPWEPYTGGKSSPSPDYPQPIISTGTVTTGAQMLDFRNGKSGTVGGITYTNVGDGTYKRTGTVTSSSGAVWFLGGYNITPNADDSNVIVTLKKGVEYIAKDCWLFWFLDNAAFSCEEGKPFTPESDIKITGVRNPWQIEGSTYNDVIRPMLVEGDTIIQWEPYTGGKPSPSEEYPQPLGVTVTGANLFDANAIKTTSSNGISFVNNNDGSITVKGTSLDSADTYGVKVDLQPGIYHTSGGQGNVKIMVRVKDNGETKYYSNHDFVVSTDSYVDIYMHVDSGKTVDITIWPMLNAGSTALPWQPYQSCTATIQLTAPLYGIGDVRDRIMCKDGEWGIERQFIALTFDGSENWEYHGTAASDQFRLALSNYMGVIKNEENADKPIKIMCDRLKAGSSSNTYGRIDCISSNTSGRIYIYLDDFSSGDVAAFKTYLSTHPIRAIFERATPTWEPLPSATQTALNALTTYTGTTHVTITAGGPEPDVAVEYVQDTKAVIADIMAQINEIRNGGTT